MNNATNLSRWVVASRRRLNLLTEKLPPRPTFILQLQRVQRSRTRAVLSLLQGNRVMREATCDSNTRLCIASRGKNAIWEMRINKTIWSQFSLFSVLKTHVFTRHGTWHVLRSTDTFTYLLKVYDVVTKLKLSESVKICQSYWHKFTAKLSEWKEEWYHQRFASSVKWYKVNSMQCNAW